MITHLTAKELAARLRRIAQTLAHWRVKGTGPKFIAGRPVLYPLAEVEAGERANLVCNTSNDGGSNA